MAYWGEGGGGGGGLLEAGGGCGGSGGGGGGSRPWTPNLRGDAKLCRVLLFRPTHQCIGLSCRSTPDLRA